MRLFQYTFFAAITLFLLQACQSSDPLQSDNNITAVDDINSIHADPIHSEAEVDAILQSVPSPIEVGYLIQQSDPEFHIDYLNPPANYNLYDSPHELAINLGVYTTDFSYANIYGDPNSELLFMYAVGKLVDKLKLNQHFDADSLINTIKSGDKNNELIILSLSNFERINLYLQEDGKSQLSALMLFGGWIEGLNLLCEVYSHNHNKEIAERIAEQKIILSQFTRLFSYYSYDPNMVSLIRDLNMLLMTYEMVEINRFEEDKSNKRIKKANSGISTGHTEANISNQNIDEIRRAVIELRAHITKN